MNTSRPMTMWIDDIIDKIIKHKNKLIIATTILAVASLGTWGFFYHKTQLQIKAHKNFVTAIKLLDIPVISSSDKKSQDKEHFKTEEEKWTKVEQEFREGYDKSKGTELASMFLAFQSEAFLHLGHLDQASKILKKAIAETKSDTVKQYYNVKLSLMQLDSGIAEDEKEGLERLQSIANNQRNIANDQALFHLWEYFKTKKNKEQATNYGQRFIAKYGNEESLVQQIEAVKSWLELVAV